MPYTINKSDGSVIATLQDYTKDITSTSLTLLGRGVVNYGESVAENFVKLTENFASPTGPAHPLEGQIWFDTSGDIFKVYAEDEWVSVFQIIDGVAVMLGTIGADVNPTPNTLSKRDNSGRLYATAFKGGPADTALHSNTSTSATTATTATNATNLNSQPASYYTNIIARLGYTPVNKAGDTMTDDLRIYKSSATTTGKILFGTSGSTSINYDGSKFDINAPVNVTGTVTASTSMTAPTFNGNATTSTTSTNSTQLGGKTGATTATANTVALRDANADITARYFKGRADSAIAADTATTANTALQAANSDKLDNFDSSKNNLPNTVVVRDVDSDIAVNKVWANGLMMPHRIAVNGYYVTTGGFIEQFGHYNGPLTDGGYAVTFPIPFPGNCISAIAVARNSASTFNQEIFMQTVSMDETGATFWANKVTGTTPNSEGFFWRALGTSTPVDTSSIGGDTGGSGGDPEVEPGDGGGGCVYVESWLPSGIQAGEAEVGDDLYVINVKGSDYMPDKIRSVTEEYQPCVRLTTKSGITLICSTTTPITYRSGHGGINTIGVFESINKFVPVLDYGEYRWETIIDVEEVGELPVRLINVNDGTYAAGEIQDRYIFTHNFGSPGDIVKF